MTENWSLDDLRTDKWVHIDATDFWAEMERLSYGKVFRDNPLLGEIIGALIKRHNEVLAEYDVRWLDDLRAGWTSRLEDMYADTRAPQNGGGE